MALFASERVHCPTGLQDELDALVSKFSLGCVLVPVRSHLDPTEISREGVRSYFMGLQWAGLLTDKVREMFGRGMVPANYAQ